MEADEAAGAAEEVAEAAGAEEPLEKWTPVVAEVTTELDKMTSVLTGVTEVKVVSDGRAVRVEAEREVTAEDWTVKRGTVEEATETVKGKRE